MYRNADQKHSLLFSLALALVVVSGLLTSEVTLGNAAASAPGPRVAWLSWHPPTSNDDGSALQSLVGYRIYGGRHPDQMTLIRELHHPGTTAYVIEHLDEGTHYFAMSSIDKDGQESALSAVLTVTIL